MTKNLHLDGKYTLSPQNYFVDAYCLLAKLNICTEHCPAGYSIERLTEEHNHFTSAQIPWLNMAERPPDTILEYHKQCIQRSDTTAAYHGQDTTSVA